MILRNLSAFEAELPIGIFQVELKVKDFEGDNLEGGNLLNYYYL